MGDAEPLDGVDGETGGLDGGAGVAVGMAAAPEGGPYGGVEDPLDTGEAERVGADVLEEPELPTGHQDPPDLGQGGGHVGHRAEHQRGDCGVEAGVVGG